jgi:hypothetical protein
MMRSVTQDAEPTHACMHARKQAGPTAHIEAHHRRKFVSQEASHGFGKVEASVYLHPKVQIKRPRRNQEDDMISTSTLRPLSPN